MLLLYLLKLLNNKNKVNKSILLKYWLLWLVFLIWLSFASVFSAWIFLQNVDIVYKLSNNVYLNSESLNKTYLVYESNYDISDAYFQSSCETNTKLIEKKENLYLFELTINDKNCSNNVFFLKSKLWILNEIKINLVTDLEIYTLLLDYSSKELNNVLKTIDKSSAWLKIFSEFKNNLLNDKYKFSKKKRVYEELLYKWEIIKQIIEKRELKYSIPVPWYDLPTSNPSKFPNSWRPYRALLTDWIHHSWDIDAPFGTKVVSLDDWVIIRIVKNWNKADLWNLRKWKWLTEEDKMRNLDIYRWNQVWIKTMKWELVMYAHLDKVVDTLVEWTMISRWDYVWNIWVTGVPEEWYNDFHLDFSVGENPFNQWKAWSYDIVDYMSWPWKFKGKSKDYIVEHQYDIFKK